MSSIIDHLGRPIELKQPDFNDPRIWTVLTTANPFGVHPPKDHRALLDAYQSWVQICVRKIATSLAMAPFRIYRDDGTGGLGDLIDRHIFYDLLRRPNSRMTRMQFLLQTFTQWELTGSAYWYAPGGFGGRPRAIYVLNPAEVLIQTKYDGDLAEVIGYKYGAGKGAIINLPPEEVVHFRHPHPNNALYGISPLSSQEYPYDIDTALEQHEYSFFKNRAVVDLLFSASGMDQDQAEAFLAKWRQKHQGAKKSYEPAIIPADDIKVTTLNQTARDSQTEEMSGRQRDKMLAAYDVPAGKVGLIKDVNRANGEFLDTIFARECLKPRAILFCETLDAQLLPRYDRGMVCELYIEVPKDREFLQRAEENDVTLGIRTRNEVRDERGMGPVPWGDVWWAPFSVVAVNSGESEEPTPEEAPTKTMKATTKDQRELRWKRFIARTGPREKKMAADVRAFFNRQESEILERIKKLGPKAIGTFAGWSKGRVAAELRKRPDLVTQLLGDGESYQASLKRTMLPHEREALMDSGIAALEEVGAVGIDFSVAARPALEWVEWKAVQSAKKVNEATFAILGDTLSEGLVAGEGIPELQKRVQTVFADSWRGSKVSSERIARTEIIGASNKGALEGYKAAGVDQKEWLAAIDERTREEHAAADGQVVAINQPFSVGGETLEAPGDPDGSPENIINCRCTVAPVIE